MRCLDLWVWISKSLVLRDHNLSQVFIGKLIEWLDNSVISDKCSEAFGLILNNEATQFSLMTSKTAANIKLLFRQKLFDKTVFLLKRKFDSEEEINKCKFLVLLNRSYCLLIDRGNT